MSMEIVDNITPNLEEWRIFKELNLIEVDADILYRKFSSLSGGEKVKFLLICAFLKENKFLLIDEPTNHIDIDTREILEEALKEYKGTALFVSHDRFFINAIANRVLNIEDYKIKSYYGNYDDFTMKNII